MASPPTTPTAPAQYPVRISIDHQAEYSRFLPLVKWLLVLPHYIALMFVGLAALFAGFFAFFAVLFTGRYPKGLHDFVVGVLRWGLRVGAYILLMTDRYPAFSLQAGPDDAARLEIDYPSDGVARWRPLVHWLLIYPYSLLAGILVLLAYFLSFFAFFTILFTKRFPRGMFDIALVALNWQMRSYAYEFFLVTRYPPFVWG